MIYWSQLKGERCVFQDFFSKKILKNTPLSENPTPLSSLKTKSYFSSGLFVSNSLNYVRYLKNQQRSYSFSNLQTCLPFFCPAFQKIHSGWQVGNIYIQVRILVVPRNIAVRKYLPIDVGNLDIDFPIIVQ